MSNQSTDIDSSNHHLDIIKIDNGDVDGYIDNRCEIYLSHLRKHSKNIKIDSKIRLRSIRNDKYVVEGVDDIRSIVLANGEKKLLETRINKIIPYEYDSNKLNILPDQRFDRSRSPKKRERSKSPRRRERSRSLRRRERSKSPKKRERSKSSRRRERSKSPRKRERSRSPRKRERSKSPKRRERSKSPRYEKLESKKRERSRSPQSYISKDKTEILSHTNPDFKKLFLNMFYQMNKQSNENVSINPNLSRPLSNKQHMEMLYDNDKTIGYASTFNIFCRIKQRLDYVSEYRKQTMNCHIIEKWNKNIQDSNFINITIMYIEEIFDKCYEINHNTVLCNNKLRWYYYDGNMIHNNFIYGENVNHNHGLNANTNISKATLYELFDELAHRMMNIRIVCEKNMMNVVVTKKELTYIARLDNVINTIKRYIINVSHFDK